MRRLSTKLPALIVLSTGIATLFAFSIICGIGGQTAQQFAPIPQATAQIALDRRSQEAQVTATYIAVLNSEIVSDTQTTHAIGRTQAYKRLARNEVFETALLIGGVIIVGAAAVGGGVWIGGRGVASGVKHIRQALLPLPLPDAALLYGKRIIDTRDGAGWSVIEDRAAQIEHARAVREYRSIWARAFIKAFAEGGGVKLLTGGRNENGSRR